MIEQMGFEKDRRIRKEYKNKECYARIGFNDCHFKSEFERDWAYYLQMLLESDPPHIDDWQYEPHTFRFEGFGYSRGPYLYIPDFKVFDLEGGHYWQECKGHHDGQTNSKLLRMAYCYPDEIMELVLQSIPKKNKSKGANRRAKAAKYTRRVMDGTVILKQAGII